MAKSSSLQQTFLNQISLAGKKKHRVRATWRWLLGGALTIGTMDGANVEIREEVGDENIYIFGLDVDGVVALKAQGYNPCDYYNADPLLRKLLWIYWLAMSSLQVNQAFYVQRLIAY